MALETSVSTVRRDLKYLDDKGYLERTHGGAVWETTNSKKFEPGIEIAAALASDAKEAIGMAAAAIVKPGQTVIFDSGTTTLAAARRTRAAGTAFTAVTNDLTIAATLSADATVEVVVPGGTVRPGSPTMLGITAQRFIDSINADIALIGTHAVSDGHLSDTGIDLAEIKQAMIRAAERVILLADSSKFGGRAFAKFAQITEIDLLITDSNIDPDIHQDLLRRGIRVEAVDPVSPVSP